MDRRDFLQTLAGLSASLMLCDHLMAQAVSTPSGSDKLGKLLPLRTLGTTGKQVTMLGLGGWHIGKMDDLESQKTIEVALEGGVRFFDTAESYQEGESEKRYGRYLIPKYRDHVFLMTKTTAKDATTARAHLDGSLKRLNTDYLDLWQIHSVTDPEDVDTRLANGVLDVVLEAREKGKVRHIGFTGHRRPSAQARMLEKTDVLQTCQMPINVIDPSYESFITRVMPTLVERKMGVLAMKTLSNGFFFKQNTKGAVIPDRITVEQALDFVWSLPVSVLITGPDDARMMQQNIEYAANFTSIDEAGRMALIEKVADLAGRPVEYYKRV